MNKFYLTSLLMAIFTLPSFADINKNASTATCDSATIGATSGNAYMDTAWTANTINLDFYSDGEKISTGSCTYDGAIELPNDPEDKTGYTFAGWKVRAASNNNENQNNNESNNNGGSNNILSTLDVTQDGFLFLSKNATGNTTGALYNNSSYTTLEDTPYANYLQLTNYLNNNQWVAMFNINNSNIAVIGDAKCSASDSDIDATDGHKKTYCWCKASSYTSDFQTIENVTSSWLYSHEETSGGANTDYAEEECGFFCAYDCAREAVSNSSFRTELYGQSN